MKEKTIKVVKIIGIVIIIVYFGYIIIWGEIKSHKETTRFCKEQCNYFPDKREWKLNLEWVFDKEGVVSNMDTQKSFSEKNLDECINYCRDLGEHLKYLLYPPER